MPQVIRREQESSHKKPASNDTAVVRQQKASTGEPREISVKVVVVAGVLALLVIAFLYNTYINPFISPVQKIERVPPLPGFADQPPYNTKAWQEAYKAGRAGPISGVPRGPAAAAVGRQ